MYNCVALQSWPLGPDHGKMASLTSLYACLRPDMYLNVVVSGVEFHWLDDGLHSPIKMGVLYL